MREMELPVLLAVLSVDEEVFGVLVFVKLDEIDGNIAVPVVLNEMVLLDELRTLKDEASGSILEEVKPVEETTSVKETKLL